MKKLVFILLFCFFIGSFPLKSNSSSQWKFFEHRYKYGLEDVINASKFVEKNGYWEGYRNGKLVGYVFISKDWAKRLLGYSGKHMETLIGMDHNGVLTGVKLLFHSEPIVLIGLKEEYYRRFLKQYKGKSIMKKLSVGKGISMDAITGATLTAVVHNAIILESSRKVAIKTGLFSEAKKKPKRKISNKYTRLEWNDLISSRAVNKIIVNSKELGIPGDNKQFIGLYYGILTPPSIGKNILGDDLYNKVMARKKEGESVLFIASKGEGTFKGISYVRGGKFDRFNLEQSNKVFVFTDMDYWVLSEIMAKNAPAINEGGIFFVRDKTFNETMEFKFNLLLRYRIKIVKREYKEFTSEYKLPDRFLQ